jgi:hypothetical protein
MRRNVVGSLAVILIVLLTISSPYLAEVIADTSDLDWQELSDVGQAFGMGSALFSALAFAAVAWSINVQVRESKAQRLETHRQIHLQLITLGLQDVQLQVAFPLVEDTLEAQRRHQYLNIWFWWWRYNYRAGLATETELRGNFEYVFQSPPGRNYVEATRAGRPPRLDRLDVKFFGILDEEYARALETPPDNRSLVLLQERNATPPARGQRAKWAAYGGVAVLSLGVAAVRSRSRLRAGRR